MKNNKFSVIIPVFNVEKYLDECIESVVNQTYLNWELFLVDDGSSDNSLEICKKYKNKFKDKIKILKSKHKGVSHARNLAMKKMSGDYCIFLDSDDYFYEIKFFEKLNKLINSTNADCYVGNFFSFSESEDIPPLKDVFLLKERINNLPQKDVLDYFYSLRLIYTVWRFVVKVEIIKENSLCMVENIIHEDEEWCVKTLLKCMSFCKIEEPHYIYRKRKNSIMTYGEYQHFENYLKVTQLLLNLAQKQTDEDKKIFVQRCAYKCAGQVYYGLKDISNFLPPAKTDIVEEKIEIPSDIKIFMCSTGCGKTYLAAHNSNYVDLDLIKTKCHFMLQGKTDEEIEKLKGEKGLVENKNYPQNYFDQILKYLKENKKLLLVSSTLERDFFIKNKLDYCLIYPSPSCQQEYQRRLQERGNSLKFSREVASKINYFYSLNNLDNFAKAKVVLKPGQYLSDILK